MILSLSHSTLALSSFFSFTLSATTSSFLSVCFVSHIHTLVEHLAHLTWSNGEEHGQSSQSESETTIIINVKNCEQIPLERNVENNSSVSCKNHTHSRICIHVKVVCVCSYVSLIVLAAVAATVDVAVVMLLRARFYSFFSISLSLSVFCVCFQFFSLYSAHSHIRDTTQLLSVT